MTHSHDHHHDASGHYIEQLFTIAVCGALGAVAVLLWAAGKLAFILDAKFDPWVLAGGITLIALSAIRAVALWFEVDQLDEHAHACCGHDHDHEHEHEHEHDQGHDHGCCGHDHAHEHEHAPAIQGVPAQAVAISSLPLVAAPVAAPVHEPEHVHSHDHDHEHGWGPWRYVVLLLPVLLYLLNIPSEGVRGAETDGDVGKYSLGSEGVVAKGEDYGVGFTQLEEAANRPDQREFYQGKRVRLSGRFFSNDPKFFRLVRYQMKCCAADAVPVNVTLMVDPKCKEELDIDRYNGKWVEVTGYVHFLHRVDTNEHRTAVIIRPKEGQSLDTEIQEIPPPANPYVS